MANPDKIEAYDSTRDTLDHIYKVQASMLRIIKQLKHRANVHDQSKLQFPEREVFDEYTPLLKTLTYGSDEYREALMKMKPALDHHYANNPHHPEYHEAGIRGMSLLDLIEMLADWEAAGRRHADGGDILRSIKINQTRFGYSDELAQILTNTAKELGMVPKNDNVSKKET